MRITVDLDPSELSAATEILRLLRCTLQLSMAPAVVCCWHTSLSYVHCRDLAGRDGLAVREAPAAELKAQPSAETQPAAPSAAAQPARSNSGVAPKTPKTVTPPPGIHRAPTSSSEASQAPLVSGAPAACTGLKHQQECTPDSS